MKRRNLFKVAGAAFIAAITPSTNRPFNLDTDCTIEVRDDKVYECKRYTVGFKISRELMEDSVYVKETIANTVRQSLDEINKKLMEDLYG